MIRQFALQVAIFAGLTGPAISSDSDSRYAVEGPGRLACSEFNTLAPTDVVHRDVGVWLTGYMTAHHRLLPQTFDLSPWQTPETLLGMLAQYCEANPKQVVERGAQELVSYLAPKRVQKEALPLMQRSGDTVTLLYEEVLDGAAEALDAAGFPIGSGEAALADSVLQFQKQQGLPETGALDQPTLARLLR